MPEKPIYTSPETPKSPPELRQGRIHPRKRLAIKNAQRKVSINSR
jgi:hypothetical protein